MDLDLLVLPEMAFSGVCAIFSFYIHFFPVLCLVLSQASTRSDSKSCFTTSPMREQCMDICGSPALHRKLASLFVVTDKQLGYNFQSLPQISVHLEPTAAGPSTAWARDIARRLGCHVIVGYPEHCTQSPSTPQGSISRFNSAVLVSPKGNVLTNYRKSFLYTTDESWAQEGPGFYAGDIPGGVGKMSMGICLPPAFFLIHHLSIQPV